MPKEKTDDSNADRKKFCSIFFFFFAKNVPTRTESHPNSNLFEPKCIVGGSKQYAF